jgi:hypothetical protein
MGDSPAARPDAVPRIFAPLDALLLHLDETFGEDGPPWVYDVADWARAVVTTANREAVTQPEPAVTPPSLNSVRTRVGMVLGMIEPAPREERGEQGGRRWADIDEAWEVLLQVRRDLEVAATPSELDPVRRFVSEASGPLNIQRPDVVVLACLRETWQQLKALAGTPGDG